MNIARLNMLKINRTIQITTCNKRYFPGLQRKSSNEVNSSIDFDKTRPQSRILVSNSFLTQYKLALRMDKLSRMNMFNSQLIPTNINSQGTVITNKKIFEALVGLNLDQKLKNKHDESIAIKKIKIFERLFRKNDDDEVKAKNKDDNDKTNKKKKDDDNDDEGDDGSNKRYQSEDDDDDDDDGDQEELIPSC